MEELLVVNVCLLGGKDPLQNVLQVPNDIKWQDFELLVCNFSKYLTFFLKLISNSFTLASFCPANVEMEQVRRNGIDIVMKPFCSVVIKWRLVLIWYE